MLKPKTIAIDGPAGSGKSTLGQELASRLGYAMLDAGMLYRLATRSAIARGADDATSYEAAAREAFENLQIQQVEGFWCVRDNGVSLTELGLHDQATTTLVPAVAQSSAVRQLVREVQARVIETGHAILAGRDIGTVVAPQAELKLYLDVSLAERASRRRWAAGTSQVSQVEIEAELERRDGLDSTREHSPLRVPDDAVVVRTDQMSVDEAVESIVAMCGLEPVVPA